MNLQTTLEIYGGAVIWSGGLGSGCHGPTCGRKPSAFTSRKAEQIEREVHDPIKYHPLRRKLQLSEGDQQSLFRQQEHSLVNLARQIQDLPLDEQQKSAVRFEIARSQARQLQSHREVKTALMMQDGMLSRLHQILRELQGKDLF